MYDDQDRMVMRALGNRLRDIREGLGLSRPEMSAITGISVGNLLNYEHGKHSPYIATLHTLASALNMTMSELLEGI